MRGAPNGASALTPLTTLVRAVAQAKGGDIAAAQAKVAAALGLSSGTDLLSLDPVAAARAGTPGGAAAYAAAAQAQDTAALLSAAGSTGGYAAIAATIDAAPGRVDLADTSTLSAIGAAAGLSGANLSATVALAQSSNAALAAAVAAATPAGIVAAVAGVQSTAQGTIASTLPGACGGGDAATVQHLLSSYAPQTVGDRHCGDLSRGGRRRDRPRGGNRER